MKDIERLPYADYVVGMEAYAIKKAREQENLALQAWFNQSVQATTGDKNPKPKFKAFRDFYNLQEEIDNIRAKTERDFVPEKPTKKQANDVFNQRYQEFLKLKERRSKNGGKL